ncbi:MAG: nucleotide exchange factor GrpE [Candidatus Paceibacterota bacterium]
MPMDDEQKNKNLSDNERENLEFEKDNGKNDSDIDMVVDDEGESVQEKIKKLRDKLKEAEKLKQEYLDGWQRSRADFVNARKKDEELRAELVKYSNEDLLNQIIPVLDSFEMAFSNKEAWEKVSKEWRVGVEYIYNQLQTVLENNNVKQISPQKGEKFDHYVHSASELVAVDDPNLDGTITDVLQKGYKIHDRVIRAARVKVAEFKK